MSSNSRPLRMEKDLKPCKTVSLVWRISEKPLLNTAKKKGIGYNLVFNCPCLFGFKPPWEFLFCTPWFFVYLY